MACHERGVLQHAETNGSGEPARNPKYELPPAIIAFPFARRETQPFVAHPFPCPIDAYEQAIRSNTPNFPFPQAGNNLILTALAWQDALNADPTCGFRSKVTTDFGLKVTTFEW